MRRRAHRLFLCLLPVLLLTAVPAGCDKAASAIPPKVNLAAHRLLTGGDNLSWPTSAGTAADANYCRARLRLPLATEPAWTFEYSAAEFSNQDTFSILHRDGLLILSAYSPQLLGLDVTTGAVRFNQSLYDYSAGERQTEYFDMIYLTPHGLLVGHDGPGRIYCWSLDNDSPRRLWLSEETGEGNALLAINDCVWTYWDGFIRCLSAADGAQELSYPALIQTTNVVATQSGTTVTWTTSGEFFALDSNGAPLWSYLSGISGPAFSITAVVDEATNAAYLKLPNETLECRDLTSGELRWSHTWADLMTDEQRIALFGSTEDALPPYAVSLAATPQGPVMSIISGQVLALDHDGNRRWVYRTNVPVLACLVFENGLLASERFLGPNHRGFLQFLTAFCPETIDWQRVQEADEERRLSGSFQRMVVIDPGTGTLLDAFEPELPALAITPAHDKLIFSERSLLGVNQHRVLAYNWLEWDADGQDSAATEKGN
ncbi:PQQ-binding-like beta-propeller repeat protein [bacterium]|nr:PQQ-binding-like beta-propeller repeat protein [bacterium]